MELAQGFQAFSMTRTHPLHIGDAPLTSLVARKEIEKEKRTPGKFESLVMGGLNSVNDNQLAVSKIQKQLITDPDSVDVHDVTTAMAKAQLSLSMAQTVIERLVSGWNEISTTR